MNPFDFYGPEFLLFYICCIAAGVGLLRVARRLFEGGEPPKLSFRAIDPYLVAHLREGEEGAIRVTVLSLIDRGLLTVESGDGASVKTRDGAIGQVRRPLERDVLELFVRPRAAKEALKSKEILRPAAQ